jgi:hypothetical protein
MTTSNVAAQVLVRAYLNGRSMDEFMFAAAVWMADQRLTGGMVPALDRGTAPYKFAVPRPQWVR